MLLLVKIIYDFVLISGAFVFALSGTKILKSIKSIDFK
jgi:hypothetical protein